MARLSHGSPTFTLKDGAHHMGNIPSNHLVRGCDLSEDEKNPGEEINLSVNPSS
ncbi:hypothetical protein CsSME_00016632 [Camellia sinensis var. sinensis]